MSFFGVRSTPPRRRRPLFNTLDLNIREVSIHCSAQEATTWSRRDDEAIQVSIHASAQEATGTLRRPFQQDQRFDPRLRAGGDDRCHRRPSARRCFDPRLRAGGDPEPLGVARVDQVSIHASAQEATLCAWGDGGCAPYVSIHARSEEHTSELQSLMRISYAVFCLKKKKVTKITESLMQD